MNWLPIWITGESRCGKTTRLIEIFNQWLEDLPVLTSPEKVITANILVFAANDDNRRELADKLSVSIKRSYPIIAKTPLGFINEEVKLFFPLILQELNLKSQFPIRLRPETEQELATKLWKNQLKAEELLVFGGEYNFVRRILDLLQLAGAAGVAPENIPQMLKNGLSSFLVIEGNQNEFWEKVGKLLMQWREWCLEKGLLSYSLIYELYWRYLLPNSTYQQHLTNRYQAIFADDLDDYPAISKDLFSFFLDNNCFGVFTFNECGKVRLGLNADPHYLKSLNSRCKIELLNTPPVNNIGSQISDQIIQLINNPLSVENLPDCVRSLCTISRAELLRNTAELIVNAIKQGDIKPDEIAIIAPGLDDIGRYSLINILTNNGIAVEPLNEQRPLISSPLIRALLTLLGLVYEGLGQLVPQDAVAEMLVVLSQSNPLNINNEQKTELKSKQIISDIDPVRAGLLADYCYFMDIKSPNLLPVETFPRWDRLGHKAVNCYNNIREWIEQIKETIKQQKDFTLLHVLDKAINKFFGNNSNLDYSKLADLRELIETAQHFLEVEKRLRNIENYSNFQTEIIGQFIQLLKRGTITANPYPLPLLKHKKESAITLANIYQYRSLRSNHRWQIWLDVSSNLWGKSGSSELFGAPLFLKEWSGNVWKIEDQMLADKERLERILRDLLARTTERFYLCHSEIGINGDEQTGALLTLINLATEV